MPNWCNNTITIRGPIQKIEALWEVAKQDAEDNGLLDAMHPMPKELHDTTSPSDGPNWYDWRVSNWGTKWEVSSEGLEYTPDPDNGTAAIDGWFDSAWSPPMGALYHYAAENPDVAIELKYHEPGMCYFGEAEWADGECVLDDCVDYSEYTAATVRDMIGADLDDYWAISENMQMWEEENDDATHHEEQNGNVVLDIPGDEDESLKGKGVRDIPGDF
jgi:hypothetical protein